MRCVPALLRAAAGAMPFLRHPHAAVRGNRRGEGPVGLASLQRLRADLRLLAGGQLLRVGEAQHVLREVHGVDLVVEHAVDGRVAHETLEAPLQLLEGHLLAVLGEEGHEVVAREGPRLVALHGLEGLPDLLGPNCKDWPVVHVEPDKVVETDPVDVLAGLTELRVLDLVLHVLDLELRGEVPQGAHEVRDLLHGDHPVQDPGLGGVLILGLDLGVVEVVLHVREELAVLSAVQQLHERLDARAAHDARACHGLRVNEPLVHRQVVAPAGEGVLPLVVHGDGGDLRWVRDEAHALVRVPVERQLHQAKNLLMRRIEHELLLAVHILVHGRHPRDRSTVRGRESGLPAGPVHGVPDLELVLIIHRQHLLVVAPPAERVPDAARRPRLLLHHRVRGHYLQAPELRALDAVLHEPPVLAHREQPELLRLGPGEAQADYRSPMRLVLRRVAPLLRIGLVVVPVRVPVEAHAPVGVGQREVRGVVAKDRVRHAVAGVAEGDDRGEIGSLEQLAVAVAEADGKELPIRRELKDVWHELVEDLDEVQRSGVVVPQVHEAGVAANSHQGQQGVAAEPMHRRVQALQDEPAPAVLRGQLVEEPRLDEHDQGGTGAHEEVRALEVVLHTDAAAAGRLEVLAVVARLLEGDGLHGASGEVLEPRLHAELVVVEAHRPVRRADDHPSLLVHLQHVQGDAVAKLDDLHGSPLVGAAEAVDNQREVPDHDVAVNRPGGSLG
mmetsp:Transcript_16321/g.44971  ORF Transcript_16321/g.44971 Transcript_16321/m.44971 type:complete len:727 (-) Transcript_16321:817-2997(-)